MKKIYPALFSWKPFLILSGFVFLSATLFGQAGKATVKGKTSDSLSLAPLSFSGIKIFKSKDKKLENESVANEEGNFSIELNYGQYFAQIEFMGYKPYKTAEFTVSKEHSLHELGLIKLVPKANTLQEVVVQSEKSSMQLSLDKKIFNVGKDLANAGGSASDILTNIPSVSVDPDGGVRLRGSDNVRILIDGKPSGLVSFKGGSGLQQLPGSMIDRVEIITNPSARYEAEGMAGIINIILKKDRRQGFNGSFEVTAGNPTNLGGAANLNYRHKKINFFINYGIAYRRQPNQGSIYQEVYGKDSTYILKQNNNGQLTGFSNNIRGGLDYFFKENSTLTASYLFRRSDANRKTSIRYEDYLNNTAKLTGISTRTQDENEVEPNSEY